MIRRLQRLRQLRPSLPRLSRRHAFSAALVAVGVPLAVLLWLQYRSLVRLEHLSEVARRATLDNYLEAVTNEVRYFYETGAERALNLPASVFTEPCYDSAGFHFKKKGVRGARRLFLVNFLEAERGRMVFFEPDGERSALDPYSEEYRAIYVAASSWSVFGHKGIPIGPAGLSIDERHPDHRIILNPITDTLDDETGRLVGLAGMVVDRSHFEDELLPEIVEGVLPDYFSGGPESRPTVLVRDGAGRVAYSSRGSATGAAKARSTAGGRMPAPEDQTASRALPFVFTDWRVGVIADAATAERVARQSFGLNLGLTGLLGLALLGGVTLALATAARAMRLSRMKSDFVSNVSHELRTPLASIRAFGELLSRGRVARADGTKVREYGGRIEAESRRLTALINNILDFSRIESGRKTYDFEEGDVGEVVDAVLASFEPRLREKGLALDVTRPVAPLPAVRFDRQALVQVVSNLLDNAVKYSGDGREIGVTVESRGRRERRESGVAIAVRDRGIGIRREDRERIFERFHRVPSGPDGALVHDVKGSGLGLALVHQIVRAHGGEVAVESAVGEGTVFTVWLPAATVESGIGD